MMVSETHVPSSLLDLFFGQQVWVQTKALSIQFVLNAEERTSIANIVTGSVQVRTSLDRALSDIEVETLAAEFDNLITIIHAILIFNISIFGWHGSTENHDLLTSHLNGSSMQESKLLVVRDVVDVLPQSLLDIKSFNLLHKLEGAE